MQASTKCNNVRTTEAIQYQPLTNFCSHCAGMKHFSVQWPVKCVIKRQKNRRIANWYKSHDVAGKPHDGIV